MGRGNVNDVGADGGLDDVDSEIKDVNQQDCKDHGDSHDPLVLAISAKKFAKERDDFTRPAEKHERRDGCNSTTDDEWPSLSPSDPAVVALQSNVGLHKHTREGAGDPDQCKHRLAEPEGQQIGLHIIISIVMDLVDERLTEPLDVSTDHPI